jgi:hypothetical protein
MRGENMTYLLLSTLIACGDKEEDTAVVVEDTAVEDTDTTDTDTDTNTDTDTDTDTPMGTAMVRVVHLSPDAPNVDVYANQTMVAGLEDVPFLAGSGFLELPAGEYTFEVVPTGAGYDNVVPVPLTATLNDGDVYTAIAHGYVDSANGSNGFAITPFAGDLSAPTAGNFRVQVVHAAPADAFAQVDIWNITDMENATPLIPDFDYGATVTTELPMGIGFVLGVDIDNNEEADAIFTLPDNLSGFVGLYAVNDTSGVPHLVAHFEDGQVAVISPDPT